MGYAGLDLLRHAAKALNHFVAARRHVLDDAFAGATQRGRDVLAPAINRLADAVAGRGDCLDNALRGLLKIVGEGFVRARNCAAHAFGIGDDGLALGDQFIDE